MTAKISSIDKTYGSLHHNKKFFQSKSKSIKKSREVESWFCRIFMPAFYAPPYDIGESYLYESHQQSGGGDYIYTEQYGSQTYHVRIRYLEIINDQEDEIGKLYLMSPTDDENKHRCVYARINRNKPKVVDLHDLILTYNCTDLHETPPKIGYIYVQIMTQFLIIHHEELGINKIELFDNARYRCPENRQLSVHLEKSRQLEGKYPYYMQFGYKPKYKSSMTKLLSNRKKMKNILTRDYKDLEDLCRINKCDQTVMTYIQTHQEQSMSKTLEYIGHYDCLAYIRIYEILFMNCGLKELENPLYVMKF